MIDATKPGLNVVRGKGAVMVGWRWPRLGLLLALSSGKAGTSHLGVMTRTAAFQLVDGVKFRSLQLDVAAVWVWSRVELSILRGRKLALVGPAPEPAVDLTESQTAAILDAGIIDLGDLDEPL